MAGSRSRSEPEDQRADASAHGRANSWPRSWNHLFITARST